MAFYLFKDSYQRYKVASSADASLLANMRQRYTFANGFSIDDTGGLGGGRRELLLSNGSVAKTMPHSSRWVTGFRYRYLAPGLSNSQLYFVFNNNSRLFDLLQNADGTLALRCGTTVVDVTDRSLFSNTRYYIEVDTHFTGGTPISCTAELRINGHVEASGSASTGFNASAMLSFVRTGGVDANNHQFSAVTGGIAPNTWITDLYIKNEAGYEGDIRNVPLYPASDGGILDWTPNSGTVHFDRVSTHPIDLTKWLETATPGDIDLWGFDSLPGFSGSIVGINISVVAQKDDEGTKSFKIVMGATGTDAESDEFFVSGSNAEYYEWSLKNDPTTGLPWTQAALNALIVGVKCIS